MFEFITMTPNEQFMYQWEDTKFPEVKVAKPMHLKKLVKEVCKDDKPFYQQFYTSDNCMKILNTVTDKATLKWALQEDEFTLQGFKDLYERYLQSLVGGT